VVAEKLGLEHEPRLTYGLHQFLNDLMKFGGEGAEDLCHHDFVQSNPIDGGFGDVGEDMVVQGVVTKCESTRSRHRL
jgi:hypothetical protein